MFKQLELKNIMGGPEKFGRGQNLYPGKNMGMTLQQVQEFIRCQKRSRGYEFDLSVGDNPNLYVDLSGSADLLLGLAIAVRDDDYTSTLYNGTVDLQVNNDIVIESHPLRLLTYKFIEDEYYFFPRPLSGSDDIKLNIRNVTDAQILDVVMYYI